MELASDILLISVVFFIVLYNVYLFIYLRNSFRKLPYVPIRLEDIPRLITIADIKGEKIFYDLGSGDGRVLIGFARAHKELACSGYEISSFYVFVTNLKARLNRLKNCRAKKADMFTVDVSDADIVYVYPNPKFAKLINEKILKNLKKGTKVISYCFPIVGLTPTKTSDIYGKREIFLYKI